MKIYIAGPISGLEKDSYERAFNEAEVKLKERFSDATVVNPIRVTSHLNPIIHTWNQYMSACIEKLLECDSVFMLDGWENSKGANLEFVIASELKLTVYFENFNRF